MDKETFTIWVNHHCPGYISPTARRRMRQEVEVLIKAGYFICELRINCIPAHGRCRAHAQVVPQSFMEP